MRKGSIHQARPLVPSVLSWSTNELRGLRVFSFTNQKIGSVRAGLSAAGPHQADFTSCFYWPGISDSLKELVLSGYF